MMVENSHVAYFADLDKLKNFIVILLSWTWMCTFIGYFFLYLLGHPLSQLCNIDEPEVPH